MRRMITEKQQKSIEELEAVVTINENEIQLGTNDNNFEIVQNTFESQNEFEFYYGIKQAYSGRAQYKVEIFTYKDDEIFVFSNGVYTSTSTDPAIFYTNFIAGDCEKESIMQRGLGVDVWTKAYVRSDLVTQLNSLAPQTIYMKTVDEVIDEYAFMGINLTLGPNTYKWDVDEEAFVLEGTWTNISTNRTISASLQSPLAKIGWYNS